MQNETRLLFNQFAAQVAQLNAVNLEFVAGAKEFTVEPTVQQTLVTRMQDTIAFLKAINMIPVDEMKGAKLGLTMGGTTAKRTNTASGTRRTGIDPTGLDEFGYECAKTEFDIALKYAKLDLWAKFPDFETRIRDAIVIRQALDRIMIGWNGTSVAAQTDRAANPMLEDMNIGWIEKLRLERPSALMSEGATPDKVTFGAAGDYHNLDALVWDIKETLLPPWAREDPELVVIVGRGLVHDKYFDLINREEGSMDQLARQALMTERKLGGLPTATVPFFPSKSLMVTRFDNLSLYYQQGKNRRLLRDEPELDQITDYQSSNEAYVIEDNQYACAVENIERKDA